MSQMSFGGKGDLIPVTVEIEVNTVKAEASIQMLMSHLYGVIGMLRLMGLPEESNALLMKVQRIISALNMLRVSLIAVQAASGPYGLLLAGFALTGTALTAGEVLYDSTRGV